MPLGEKRRRIGRGLAVLLGAVAISTVDAANGPPQHYQQKNLVSDVAGLAAATDPHLVNPWGLARSGTGPWWAADNGKGLATVYTGAGAIQSLVVTIPNLPGMTDPAAPTGIVANGTTDFAVAAGQPARFIFATEEGTIVAWSSGANAVLKFPVAGGSTSASYKGLTIGTLNGANQLYAANFKGASVDVFDKNYAPVNLGPNAFHDPQVPKNFAPFNVQAIGGLIYVAFAQREEGSIDEVQGPGRGYVDAFSPDGVLQKRLRWGAWFDAPWGIALAPSDFGGFSNLILVGQFGSGKIAAFDPVSGEFQGMMRGQHGTALMIEGLWAIAFGNGAAAGSATTLYFAAGIEDEAHGLFGMITPLADDDENEDEHGDH